MAVLSDIEIARRARLAPTGTIAASLDIPLEALIPFGRDKAKLDRIREQLRRWEADGWGRLPVCIAKTQYSFSTDPTALGAPTGHVLPVREVRLAAGAGFVVAVCGDIMTMPGLPRVPAAELIHLGASGQIEGLF